MKVLTSFARLAEHPFKTVRWSSGFAACFVLMGVVIYVASRLFSLLYDAVAYEEAARWWEFVWYATRALLPVAVLAAFFGLCYESKRAFAVSSHFGEIRKTRQHFAKLFAIVLFCAGLVAVATIVGGKLMFTDAQFAFMLPEFFVGAWYISLFVIIAIVLIVTMHFRRWHGVRY